MEIENKVIHYNIAQQMNTQKPAGHRQDGGRHSVSQSHRNPTNASEQIRRDDQSGIENTATNAIKENTATNAIKENTATNAIKDSLKNALISIEKHMNRGISLEVEDELGTIIVKIIDRESGETVRQIPFADAVEISKHLKARLEEMVKNQGGLFIDKEI
jgi:flagellar protein FlaG